MNWIRNYCLYPVITKQVLKWRTTAHEIVCRDEDNAHCRPNLSGVGSYCCTLYLGGELADTHRSTYVQRLITFPHTVACTIVFGLHDWYLCSVNLPSFGRRGAYTPTTTVRAYFAEISDLVVRGRVLHTQQARAT